MGWRIEFRPMDLQMNDFGNAALVVFLALITRVIISYDLDFTMPISQVNENMNTAHRRDAIRQEKFHFRCGTDVSLLYINEIINGTNDFLGLVPLVRRYITEREDIDTATRHTLEQYLLLVSKRAAGKVDCFDAIEERQSIVHRYVVNQCCLDATICSYSSIVQTRFDCFRRNSIRSGDENATDRKSS